MVAVVGVTLVCDPVLEIDDVDVFDPTDLGELWDQPLDDASDVVLELKVVLLLLLLRGAGVAVDKELVDGQDVVLGELHSGRVPIARKAHGRNHCL